MKKYNQLNHNCDLRYLIFIIFDKRNHVQIVLCNDLSDLQQINENTEPKVCLNFDPIGLDNNPIHLHFRYFLFTYTALLQCCFRYILCIWIEQE